MTMYPPPPVYLPPPQGRFYGRRILSLVVAVAFWLPLTPAMIYTAFRAVTDFDVWVFLTALLAFGWGYFGWMTLAFWRDPLPRDRFFSMVIVVFGSILPGLVFMAIHVGMVVTLNGLLSS